MGCPVWRPLCQGLSMCHSFRNILELRGLPLEYELVARKRVITSSVINIDVGASFLGISPRFLAQWLWASCTPWLWGWLRVLVTCELLKNSQAGGPSPPWVGLASFLLHQQTQSACILGEPSHLDSGSLQLPSRKKHDVKKLGCKKKKKKNSVVFFKKFILVVYSLGDSVCVRCTKIVKKAKFFPLSFWSLSCLLCLLLAFTPGCPDPHACLRQFPIPLFPGLTQLPMLHTRIHQHPSTCIHSESIHRSLYVCLTKRPPWVLLLFITASIFWVPIICQALSQILSVDYLI